MVLIGAIETGGESGVNGQGDGGDAGRVGVFSAEGRRAIRQRLAFFSRKKRNYLKGEENA